MHESPESHCLTGFRESNGNYVNLNSILFLTYTVFAKDKKKRLGLKKKKEYGTKEKEYGTKETITFMMSFHKRISHHNMAFYFSFFQPLSLQRKSRKTNLSQANNFFLQAVDH